jgi:hypothetical protein
MPDIVDNNIFKISIPTLAAINVTCLSSRRKVATLKARLFPFIGGQLRIINGMPQNTSYFSGKCKMKVKLSLYLNKYRDMKN